MQNCQLLSDTTIACSRIVFQTHIASTRWEDTIFLNISRTRIHQLLRMCRRPAQVGRRVSTLATSLRKSNSTNPMINTVEHHHMGSNSRSSTTDTAKHHLLHKTSIQTLRAGKRTTLRISHKEQVHTLSSLGHRSPTMYLPHLSKTSTHLNHP